MLCAASDANTTAAPVQERAMDAISVCCVEVTVENREKAQKLLEGLYKGETPTSNTLSEAGMKGMELTAGVDATVGDIRGVVERQMLSGSEASPATASEGACLTFFAVSRCAAQVAECGPDTEATAAEDPLVALPDELSLEEILKCQQVLVTRAAAGDNTNEITTATTTVAAAPTLLLFYAGGTRLGSSSCCCCGGLVAAILAIFCGCCMHRRTRPRSPRHSRTTSGNPLHYNDHTNSSNAGYYPNPAPATYAADNAYYPQYNNNPVPAYAVAAPAQVYYPPPQVNDGSNAGGYYKPV
ncbi:hypothetical protein ABL78_7552 [Leptomonas seymouri]|uniref:Uncharacterized protein n=1 Tax=Leptomonas seymouri TaxID=5684 RepID=A0A0N1I0G2_LEPSE|nr:hypothetical protein ABL78_7552 [Leptomonas seymouri]|eukprot:KPI83415.1 hypothetical protein ABL78_7552 [Leptomonas seymouri]